MTFDDSVAKENANLYRQLNHCPVRGAATLLFGYPPLADSVPRSHSRIARTAAD